jgi:hypothetical protein
LASLVLEVQNPDVVGQQFNSRMILNTHRLNGVACVTLGVGTYRLNNTDPHGTATVSISGP